MAEDQYDGYSVIRYTADTVWKEHSYLLVDHRTGEAALIDPGHGITELLAFIMEQGWCIRFVLATHAHFDHVAGVAEVERRFSQECIIHPKEKKLFLHAPMYSLRFGGVPMERPKNIAFLDEVIRAELENFGIFVLWTPGHTQGGMSFFYRDVAFTGDTLLKKYIGRTDLPDSDEHEIRCSVGRILATMESRKSQVIYPGHGMNWTADGAANWWTQQQTSVPHLDQFIE